MNDERNKNISEKNEDSPLKPDSETLHTTDPQEHMKGPVSSVMQKAGKPFDTDESKEDADRKRDRDV